MPLDVPKTVKVRRKRPSKAKAPSARSAKPRGKRQTKAEQRAEMMEQILDVSEDLFSKHGLHGVTLKDVAKQIGVHHTLMNYYFQDKKKLFDEVFARRAVVTSTRRIEALDAYDASTKGKPTVEGALHAFLDTDLDLYIEGGTRWKNYGRLGAQVANTPEWGAELMDKHFDPVVLGRAHALFLARHGAKIVVNDMDQSAAARVADEIVAAGGEAIAIAASVTDEAAVATMIRGVMSTWGRVDILINNAGILRDKTFAKMSIADFRLVLDVHLMGSVICTKAVWEIMRQQQYGRVVMTTSSSGLYGNFGQSNYGAAKLALVGLMQMKRRIARSCVRAQVTSRVRISRSPKVAMWAVMPMPASKLASAGLAVLPVTER